jgi:hypothetical protein
MAMHSGTSREKLAGGVLLGAAASGLVAAALGGAGTAGATCASISGIGRDYTLALPAFHWTHGMFQSPSPSVPGKIAPTVLITSTMSPRLLLL